MSKKLLLMVVTVMVLGLTLQTQASVVFSDGFEGVTPKALPEATKWDSSFSSDPGGLYFLAVESGLGPDGSNALIVKRVDPDLGQAKALFAPVTSGIVEISLDYTDAAPNPNIINFMFDWDGGGNLKMESATFNSVGGDSPELNYNIGGGHIPFAAVGGGYLTYNGGGGQQNWNHVKYTINLDADTLVAELNGVISNPISVDFGANGLENFWVRGYGNGQAAIIDNVLITAIPEPATLCLLAVGGLLLRYRKA